MSHEVESFQYEYKKIPSCTSGAILIVSSEIFFGQTSSMLSYVLVASPHAETYYELKHNPFNFWLHLVFNAFM